MTLLSAAVARYRNRRIVLLIDDPASDVQSLARSRAAAADVVKEIEAVMAPMCTAADAWRARKVISSPNRAWETRQIAMLYADASGWLEKLALEFVAQISAEFRHVDTFFVERVLRDLARLYRSTEAALAQTVLDEDGIDHHYRVLETLFCRDINVFERKSFSNLSHAPNKAMNLNSYIGLMGKRLKIKPRGGGRVLVPASGAKVDMVVEQPDFVLTLDADSLILGDYMLRLTHLLNEEPEAAVAQTPYLSFPGSTSLVERIAGATTDIQYLAHQGSTYFCAAYWVGANALIRFKALKMIARDEREGHKTCTVFIQDETVIEDTGSTIDLLDAGWHVHNYLTPLAYSATPADFGALAIQRKRWSNGGLIIFPALLRNYLRMPGRLRRLPELLLRTNYLLSPLLGNIAVFVLMIWSPADSKALMWTPLAIAPYFILYASDLKRLGYRFTDLFHVCALNLMLLPVSFAGILSSVRQMVTGRKASFTRTPKVADRTFIPPYSFVFNCLMLFLMAVYVVQGLLSHEYLGTIIPAINTTLYSYGLYRFVGVRDGLSDIALSLRERIEGAGAALARRRPGRLQGRRANKTAQQQVRRPAIVLRNMAAALAFLAVLLGPSKFVTWPPDSDAVAGFRRVGPFLAVEEDRPPLIPAADGGKSRQKPERAIDESKSAGAAQAVKIRDGAEQADR
ncbi:glycosyltransferase family 2 protein [Rhizobium sp. SGZ-381]|uniref:glycosyltransferase family 2 protein n=1 Tax=Rhizobium sp. SGZ-381 TaxID=3342800 RepID=UPI00367245BD